MSAIISGKPTPSPIPPIRLSTAIVLMFVISIWIGLNMKPEFHGARLVTIESGICYVGRGWPETMWLENHAFKIDSVHWIQNSEGYPIEATKNELRRIYLNKGPWNARIMFVYSGIAINLLVGWAAVMAAIYLCSQYHHRKSKLDSKKGNPELSAQETA